VVKGRKEETNKPTRKPVHCIIRHQVAEVAFQSKDAVPLIGVLGGLWHRIAMKSGIGRQFIRFIALVVALPFAAVFVLQGMGTEAAVSLILGILSYVFPGTDPAVHHGAHAPV